MSETSLNILQEVHSLLAEYFRDALKESMGEKGFPIPSATLGVMVAFLKNNDITADVRDANDLEALRDQLKEMKSKETGAKELVEIAERAGNLMEFDTSIM